MTPKNFDNYKPLSNKVRVTSVEGIKSQAQSVGTNYTKADQQAKIYKQYDINIDNDASLKELKDNLIHNISQYGKFAEEYSIKL